MKWLIKRNRDTETALRMCWETFSEGDFTRLWWSLHLERLTLEDEENGDPVLYRYICKALDALNTRPADLAELRRTLKAAAKYSNITLIED